MKIIQKALNLNNEDYFVKHLEIINTILPVKLTNKEIEVLAAFMSVDKKLTEEEVFNSLVRKKVMEKLKLSPGGLGNHLKAMIEKGFLNKSDITGRITIKEFLLPEEPGQGYQIKITKKNETGK